MGTIVRVPPEEAEAVWEEIEERERGPQAEEGPRSLGDLWREEQEKVEAEYKRTGTPRARPVQTRVLTGIAARRGIGQPRAEGALPQSMEIGFPQRTPAQSRELNPSSLYRGSQEPPEDWDPTPREIQRLTESGFLHPREAGDKARIWQAGQADADQGAGTTWMHRRAAHQLRRDFAHGESAVLRALLTEVPMTRVMGNQAIDTPGMFANAENLHYANVIREREINLREAEPQVLEGAREEARNRASRSMATVMQSGGGRIFVDRFDRDITDELMEQWAGRRIWNAFTNPIRYGSFGMTPETPIGRTSLVLDPQQVKYESWLNRFGRMDLTTIASAMATTGSKNPASRPNIEAYRAGEDIIMHTGDIAHALGGTEPGEDPIPGTRVAAATIVMASIIASPDIVSFLLLPVGVASKAVQLARLYSRLGKGSDLIRLAQAVRDGESASSIARQVSRLDEAFARAAHLNVQTRIPLDSTISQQIDALEGQVKTLREQAETLRTQARDAGEAYVGAEKTRLLRETEVAATERELAAGVLDVLAAEYRQANSMVADGLSWDEALARTTPLITPARKEAKEVAKRAKEVLGEAMERNEEAITAFQDAFDRFQKVSQELTEGFPPASLTTRGAPRKTWVALPFPGQEIIVQNSTIPSLGKRGGSTSGLFKGEIEAVGVPTTRPATGNPTYEIRIKIETTTGEVLEVVHPYRLDWDAANDLNTAQRQYGDAVRQHGPAIDEVTSLTMAVDDAELVYRTLLRDPVIDAFKGTKSARSNLTKAQARSEKAASALDRAAITADNALAKLTGKTADAYRTETKAVQARVARLIYAEALEEVGRGVLAFRNRGIKALGAEGRFGTGIAKAAVAKSRADIRAFGSRVDEAALNEKLGAILGSTLKTDRRVVGDLLKSGEDLPVDPGQLLVELHKHVGEKELMRFLKDPEMAPLKDALTRAARDVARGGTGREALPAAAIAEISESVEKMLRATEVKKLHTASTMWGQAVFDAWSDIGLLQRGRAGGMLRAKAASLARRWPKQFQNIPARLGEMSVELEKEVKAAEGLLDQAQLELLEIGRMPNPERAFTLYLDGTPGNIKLKEGMDRWGIATGNGSAYQKGKMQILADTRVNPLKQVKATARTERVGEKLVEKLIEKLPAHKASDPDSIPDAELEEILKELSDDLLEEISGLGRDMEQAGIPKSIVALSRAWLPSTQAVVPPRQANTLLAIAYAALNKASNYEDFTKIMKGATGRIFKSVEFHPPRAHAMSSSALILAGTLGHFSHRVNRMTNGVLTADVAADINRLWTGEGSDIQDIDKTLEALSSLGIPFTQGRYLPADTAGDTSRALKGMRGVSKELLEIGTIQGGPALIPGHLIKNLEELSGDIVKNLEASALVNRKVDIAVRAFGTHLALWRASAVTGIIMPNPRYWTNNIAGDLSQMIIEEGFGFATKRSLINFPTNIPYFGRGMQLKALYMAERVAGKSGRGEALPGILESFFTPFLGRIFKGEDGVFITQGTNRPITFKQVRNWAQEDGIFQDFVHEELMELMGRIDTQMEAGFVSRAGEILGKKYQKRQRLIQDHAGLVQHRQRMAMYVDLLHKGVPRKEAAKRTLRALYDWKHGITKKEAMVVAKLIPFYRFWRLSLSQMIDAFLEPVVKSTPEMAKRALRGNTKLARLRKQLLIWPSLPDFIYQDSPNAGMGLQDRVEALAAQFYPQYQDTRAKAGVLPMDPVRRDAYWELTGNRYTHESLLLPTTTATDSMDMLFSLVTGMGLTLAKAAEYMPYASDVLPPLELAGDYESRFLEPLLGATHPLADMLLRAGLSGAEVDLDYRQGSLAWKTLNPAEVDAFRWTPGLGSKLRLDKDTGRWEVPMGLYMTYRLLPIASTQLGRWMSAVRNPDWERGYTEGALFFLRRITGIADPKPFNLEREMEMRGREINNQYNKFVESMGDVRKVEEFERRGINVRHPWEDAE